MEHAEDASLPFWGFEGQLRCAIQVWPIGRWGTGLFAVGGNADGHEASWSTYHSNFKRSKVTKSRLWEDTNKQDIIGEAKFYIMMKNKRKDDSYAIGDDGGPILMKNGL